MRNKIMRVWLVAVATCFLVVAIIDGGAPASTAQANTVLPSVSIVPEDQEVWRGDNFNVNVVVDSSTYNLKACHVEVSYDSNAFTAETVTEAGLLGTDILIEPGSGVSNGLVTYGVTRVAGNAPEPVSGTFITMAFTVSEDALSGTYTVDVQNTILKDEDNNTIYAVLENDGQVTIVIGGRKGDFTGDGHIDLVDFFLFAAAYGSEPGDDNYNSAGDFDDNGVINLYDFFRFAIVYGT